MHIRLSLLACVSAFSVATPAFAQRTDNNAVASAEDAFGKTVVGDEQIGIYNPDDVRGFSPVSAGNLRAIGYDSAARKMVIETSTGTFEYTGVMPEFWRRFSTASSMLSFYRDNIEEEMTGRRIK